MKFKGNLEFSRNCTEEKHQSIEGGKRGEKRAFEFNEEKPENHEIG